MRKGGGARRRAYSEGHRAAAFVAGISCSDQVAAMMGGVKEKFGRLNILVKNARIGVKPFLEIPLAAGGRY